MTGDQKNGRARFGWQHRVRQAGRALASITAAHSRGVGIVTLPFLAASALIAAPAQATGDGVLFGTVEDASTHLPTGDVVVTVTSASLQIEQMVVTDKTGAYRLPELPPGNY